MKRNDVLNSTKLKRRFCTDYNLPISVYENPYFYERVSAIDVVFECLNKFEDFCLEMQRYKDEQEYFEYYNLVKDNVINYLKDNDVYKEFLTKEFKIQSEYPKQQLYADSNHKKVFISLDMKKANFSSLHYYNPEIFKGCFSWEDFMRTFTTSEHIINSKYIRQVIMGTCNPKKQITYEKYLMHKFLEILQTRLGNLPVYSISNDEIIIEAEECGYALKEFYKVLEDDPLGEYIRLNMFDLEKIKGTDGWLKKIYNFDSMFDAKDRVEFKCLDRDIFHQVVKYYYDDVIEENDLVVNHNGRLCKYLTPIENPWTI